MLREADEGEVLVEGQQTVADRGGRAVAPEGCQHVLHRPGGGPEGIDHPQATRYPIAASSAALKSGDLPPVNMLAINGTPGSAFGAARNSASLSSASRKMPSAPVRT